MLMNNCMSFQTGWVEGEDTQGVAELVFVKISRFAHLSVLPHVSFHNILSPKDKEGGQTILALSSHPQAARNCFLLF